MMQLTDGEAPVLVNGLVELDHAGNEPVVVSAQVDASRRFPQYGRDIDSRNSPFRHVLVHGDGIAAVGGAVLVPAPRRLRSLIIRFFNTKFGAISIGDKSFSKPFMQTPLPSSRDYSFRATARPWPTASTMSVDPGPWHAPMGYTSGARSFSWSYKLRPEPGDLNTRMLSALR